MAASSDPTWVGTCRSRWAWPFAGIGLILAAVTVATGIAADALLTWSWIVVLFLVVAVVMIPFTRIRVIVDGDGLHIAYGPVGWPVSHVALDAIASVHVEADARPVKWGGWGYRGSRRFLGGAAVVLRRGPAIRLELTSGATFLVTVDDADAGARALDEQRATGGRPDGQAG